MSMLLMVKAMKIKVGNPTRKLVLIKLADNANDEGVCWPSYKNIADHCEVSKRSVMSHVSALEEMGLLKRQFRKSEVKNMNQSNCYHLYLDGEQNSLGGENISLGGENYSLGGENYSLGGGENISPRTSHSLEPVNEPKRSLSASADAISVLTYMNEIVGSKYKETTKSHIENINARLKDYSIEDLQLVIDHKFKEWGSDQRMSSYLRPQTLFSAGKFDGYLRAAKSKAKPNMHDLSNIEYQSGKF